MGKSMHDDPTIAVLRALSDKTRLDIVRTLVQDTADHRASCNEVSSCSSLSQPAMSHHFKKLVDAGVLLESKKGTEKFYQLNSELLEHLGINAHKL
jgi:ArsR family transcriptional regulator